MAHSTWEVVMDPVGSNGGPGVGKANVSGVGIYLRNNGTKHEVSRVAFVRRYAEAKGNKLKPFKRQLKEELEKAYDAAATMNGINADVENLRQQLDKAEADAQTKIKALLDAAEERRRNTLERLEASSALV